MQLSLQPNEVELLRTILSQHLSELRMEIADTDKYELRETLKSEESVIKSLISRLGPAEKKLL